MLGQPGIGLGIGKAGVHHPVAVGQDIGGIAGVVLGIAGHRHNGLGLFLGFGFIQARLDHFFHLLVKQSLLVFHRAVTGLQNQADAVQFGGGLHGREGLGCLGLQLLAGVFIGGLGFHGVAFRQAHVVVDQNHPPVGKVYAGGGRRSGGGCGGAAGRGFRHRAAVRFSAAQREQRPYTQHHHQHHRQHGQGEQDAVAADAFAAAGRGGPACGRAELHTARRCAGRSAILGHSW